MQKSMKDKVSYSVCFDKKKNSYYKKKSGTHDISAGAEISLSAYRAGIHIETAKNINFTRNGLIRGTGKIILKASSGVSKIIRFYMAGGVSVETEYHE